MLANNILVDQGAKGLCTSLSAYVTRRSLAMLPRYFTRCKGCRIRGSTTVQPLFFIGVVWAMARVRQPLMIISQSTTSRQTDNLIFAFV